MISLVLEYGWSRIKFGTSILNCSWELPRLARDKRGLEVRIRRKCPACHHIESAKLEHCWAGKAGFWCNPHSVVIMHVLLWKLFFSRSGNSVPGGQWPKSRDGFRSEGRAMKLPAILTWTYIRISWPRASNLNIKLKTSLFIHKSLRWTPCLLSVVRFRSMKAR